MTTTTRTDLDFSVLGPFAISRSGGELDLGGRLQRSVLALLVAAGGERVGYDQLLVGVWGENVAADRLRSLQTYVSNLRAILGDVIDRQGDGYRLIVADDAVDAGRFEQAVDRARPLVVTDPGQAAEILRGALGRWRGRPYADLFDVPGLDSEVRRLEELRLQAVELRIDADLAAGHHEQVLAEAEALADEYPTRERFRAQHMLALYRSNRQADALRAYRRTEDYLRVELGIEPAAALRDLELRILQQDDALRVSSSAPAKTMRAAILVTDIEGSTRMWDRHAAEMPAALAAHDRIMSGAVEAADGSVFKHTGDGILSTFPNARAAVVAAESAQRALAAHDWGVVGEIRVRMGIDVGEVEARGGDFFGPPLNRAARLEAAGHGGQVLVSRAVQEALVADPVEGVQIRTLGAHRLKGLVDPEPVGQLVFVGLPAAFPDLRIGADSVLDDDSPLALPGYELRDPIGEGEFGVVYRAYQPTVGREVAVKVIRPEFAGHPAFVRRFEGEARTIARLAHPHIVPLIDFWRDAGGAYLVLQLLPGGTLAEVGSATIDRSSARSILTQIGQALDHAHAEGVAHGDLKPENVLLDGSGNAYLSDFGITARLLDPDVVRSLSKAPQFRAPEEDETGPSDAADMYALGMIAKGLIESPEAEPVLARAMAADPNDRFPTSAAFLAALDTALGEEPAVEAAPVTRNPFKGLRAFEEGDSRDFYGRDELVGALTAAVAARRWVTVVGPSGSGKSSVVQAGLLPALERGVVAGSEDWFHVRFTPGSHPTEALIEALESVATRPIEISDLIEAGDLAGAISRLLAGVDGELLLIVDQFEELFTLTEDEERRDRFVELVVEAAAASASRVRVLATLRADFYDRPLGHVGLDRLVRDGLVTVLRPTQDELVEMITGPSQAVGLRWDPGLPHRIARDVADQPGGLPLLQYLLTELVERRRADMLTGDDYERVGGVAGALATRAEAIFTDLTPGQQEAARQVLLRLVAVDEDSDDTRRRVRRTELESLGLDRAELDVVLHGFTAERLLLADRDPVTRGPTVEVAHEALLREWPRLRGWIEGQREALVLGRRFRVAMNEWNAAGRDDGYLLTGSRLAPYVGWAEASALTAEERTYYEASMAADVAARSSRQRRRRVLTGIVGGAAVIAFVLAAVAFLQQREAGEQRDLAAQEAANASDNAALAEQRADEAAENADAATAAQDDAVTQAQLARSRELGVSAVVALETDPELATLLTLEAVATSGTLAEQPSVVIERLRESLAEDRLVAVIEHGFGGRTHIDLSTDGSALAVSSENGAWVGMYSALTGELLWEYTEETADTFDSIDIEPSGDRVAVAVTDSASVVSRLGGSPDEAPNRFVVLDASNGIHLETVPYPDCTSATAVGWSPDGSRFAVSNGFDACDREGTTNGTWVEVLDGATFEQVVLVDALDPLVGPLPALDENGNLALLGFDANAVVHAAPDYATSREIPDSVGYGAFAPDGSMITTFWGGRPDRQAVFVAESGERIDILTPLPAFPSTPFGTVFSPDGGFLAIQTEGSRTVVFGVATGELLFDLPSGAQGGNPVFSADAKRLYTSHEDGKVKVWDLTAKAGGSIPVGDLGRFEWVNATGFSIGPSLGAFEAIDVDTFEFAGFFFDPATGELIGEPIIEAEPVALADGRFVVRHTSEYLIYDPATGERIHLAGCFVSDPETAEVCADTGEPAPIILMDVSLDGTEILIRDVPRNLDDPLVPWEIIDPADLSVIEVLEPGEDLDLIDSFTDSWFQGSFGEQVLVVDRPTKAVLAQFPRITSRTEITHAGNRMIQASGNTIMAIEVGSWESDTIEFGADFGRVRGMGFSPDDRLLALGGDGALFVVDLEAEAIVETFPIGGVSDIHWIDAQTLVIGTKDGVWATVSMDVSGLGEIALASLTRGYTTEECATYGLDPCLTTLDRVIERYRSLG